MYSENVCIVNVHVCVGRGTTHLEIAAYTLLGVCAGLIPSPNHNQSPRNTYQCAMGKQAIGLPSLTLPVGLRYDSIAYQLVYPNAPLVRTRPIEMLKLDQLPAGPLSHTSMFHIANSVLECML